jgi:hypothetical protein
VDEDVMAAADARQTEAKALGKGHDLSEVQIAAASQSALKNATSVDHYRLPFCTVAQYRAYQAGVDGSRTHRGRLSHPPPVLKTGAPTGTQPLPLMMIHVLSQPVKLLGVARRLW